MSGKKLGVTEIIGDKRDAILALATAYGASNVRIFGSVARGEATPDSDVDFLIDFPPHRSMFDLVALWRDLCEIVGRDVSLITARELEGSLRDHVERDAVAL